MSHDNIYAALTAFRRCRPEADPESVERIERGLLQLLEPLRPQARWQRARPYVGLAALALLVACGRQIAERSLELMKAMQSNRVGNWTQGYGEARQALTQEASGTEASCEALYHAAYSKTRLDQGGPAKLFLARFQQECGTLRKNHWLWSEIAALSSEQTPGTPAHRLNEAFRHLRLGKPAASASLALLAADPDSGATIRDRCEALIVLALAEEKLGERAAVASALDRYDEGCGTLFKNFWTRRERNGLRVRLKS